MQTAELVVYFLIALIIGGILLGTFKVADYYKNYRRLKEGLGEKPQFTVTKKEFATELARRWSDCGFGLKQANYSLYVKDSGELTMQEVVRELNIKNYCTQIDCKNKTGKFSMPNRTAIPALIKVACVNNSLIVKG